MNIYFLLWETNLRCSTQTSGVSSQLILNSVESMSSQKSQSVLEISCGCLSLSSVQSQCTKPYVLNLLPNDNLKKMTLNIEPFL